MASTENVEYAPAERRKRSAFLKIGVVGAIVVLIIFGLLHYSGLIPVHRVPRILTAPFRPAQRADTVNAIEYERPRFTFSYPRNWRIDTASEHYNPDSFLIIDAPRRGQVRLQVLPAEIDAEDTAGQVATRFQLPGLKIVGRSQFPTWGELDGHGLTLSGEKLGDPFQVRIFAHSGTQSLVVWEYWWDGPHSINADGFRLIEDSFRFTEIDGE